ncbi:carboxypeptidase-like regulatory domain-containing protein [Winogradskyella sp. PE311]|uniref:TonB-dependent receptor n=1 Tax=Winogradskyella sp. PE311 TaxID=3366943 RepID=UPI00398098B8
MRLKLILFSFIVLISSMAISQDKTEKFSFDFNNLPLKVVLNEIESASKYKFFFSETWLNEINITKSYSNQPIDEILIDLFNNTLLNYYILPSNQIILTQNSIIYDELPGNYFGADQTISDSKVVQDTVAETAPIFINRNEQSVQKTKTVRIGKERKGFTKSRYKLSGVITDVDTGKPISNLALVVKSKNLGTVTASNGSYEIYLPAGVNLLETSGLGTEKRQTRIIIYEDGTFNLNLRSQFEALSEVVLQSQGVKNVEDTNVGRTQISTEDSKNIPLVLGERDVLKVATLQPGITTAGEGATGFNVRGGKTDQNLILLEDGVIYNPSHFFGIFQALNPLVVSNVNIYKGNIPAEFGGRISSVFDIETKDADKNKFGADISVGPVTANVVVETPIIKEKSGLLIGARGTYSDWVLNALNEADLENSQASFYDFVVKYNHKINDKNEVQALGYYSKDNFSITSDSLFGYSNRLVSLKWQHQFNDKNDATLILSNSQYKFNIDYENTINDDFVQSFQIDETALKLKLDYALNKAHAISYGLSGKLYGIFPGRIEPQGQNNQITPVNLSKEQGVEGGVFISDVYKVNDKLLLDFGLRFSFFAALGEAEKRVYAEGTPRSESTVIDTVRYAKNEIIKTYGGPEFRLAARYLLSEDLSIKASANNTFQYIHTLSNNTTVSPIDIWKLSDNFIEPQQATQVSLGLYKNLNINAYELSLEGFYKWQKNTLDFKTGADIQLNEAVETEVLQGSGRAYGVELLLKKNLGDLTGWLGYTYSRSFFKLDSQFLEERVNDGQFFPSNYDKPHDVSLVLNYKLSQRISISSNFLYQTGRPVTFPTGNFQFNGGEFVQYSDRNQFRIPDYYRLDLGFNFEGNHKKNKLAHSYWSLSVYNALGRNNPYSVFFVNEDGDIKALQSSIFNIPVPSITYNISF